MQIREVITEFHFDCQVCKLSPKTIALYDRQLEYLAAYMENVTGITIIEDVGSIHIKMFPEDKADAVERRNSWMYDSGLQFVTKMLLKCRRFDGIGVLPNWYKVKKEE